LLIRQPLKESSKERFQLLELCSNKKKKPTEINLSDSTLVALKMLEQAIQFLFEGRGVKMNYARLVCEQETEEERTYHITVNFHRHGPDMKYPSNGCKTIDATFSLAKKDDRYQRNISVEPMKTWQLDTSLVVRFAGIGFDQGVVLNCTAADELFSAEDQYALGMIRERLALLG
jgi:hypothetical protein